MLYLGHGGVGNPYSPGYTRDLLRAIPMYVCKLPTMESLLTTLPAPFLVDYVRKLV
jgi:hypothetical protein